MQNFKPCGDGWRPSPIHFERLLPLQNSGQNLKWRTFMKTSTHALSLKAPKAQAFDFLSRIENLPKWATLFCQKLERDANGRHKVITPNGEIFFRIDSDAPTGVIDMYGGPTEEALAHWPTRVIALGDNESMFIFTALQYPGISDSDFAAQCQGLEREFRHIKAHVEAT
jgi:hypothetical protein